MNKELKHLFDEDQHECLNQPPDGTPEYLVLRNRCKARITDASKIVDSNSDFEGEDYFRACIIFMHGDRPEDFWKAYQCALKAVELKHENSKRFAAAAFDRWLMYQGKSQKFGMQYVPDGVQLRMWDTDPETTDEERAAWDVPPLKVLLKNIEDLNKNFDITRIKMDSKPQWLKDAIRRWNSTTQ